jgi:hypothetical protein
MTLDELKTRVRLISLAYAQHLMDLHELKGWRPGILQLPIDVGAECHTLAICHYDTKLILISDEFINSSRRRMDCGYTLEDVVKHEIAHALTPGAGHEERWRKKAAEIGLKDAWTYEPLREANEHAPVWGIGVETSQHKLTRRLRNS